MSTLDSDCLSPDGLSAFANESIMDNSTHSTSTEAGWSPVTIMSSFPALSLPDPATWTEPSSSTSEFGFSPFWIRHQGDSLSWPDAETSPMMSAYMPESFDTFDDGSACSWTSGPFPSGMSDEAFSGQGRSRIQSQHEQDVDQYATGQAWSSSQGTSSMALPALPLIQAHPLSALSQVLPQSAGFVGNPEDMVGLYPGTVSYDGSSFVPEAITPGYHWYTKAGADAFLTNQVPMAPATADDGYCAAGQSSSQRHRISSLPVTSGGSQFPYPGAHYRIMPVSRERHHDHPASVAHPSGNGSK